METFNKLVQQANTSFKTADHLAHVTYPLLNETKLIITIAENLRKCIEDGMEAVLYLDRLYKRIQQYPSDFLSKFYVFRERCAVRYKFEKDEIAMINEVHILMESKRKSNLEFVRKDRLVFASDTYKLKSLTIHDVKNYLITAKKFLDKVNQIAKVENDRRA